MAILRVTVLVALVLSVVLWVTPQGCSASPAGELCVINAYECRFFRLRCRECANLCRQLAKESHWEKRQEALRLMKNCRASIW